MTRWSLTTMILILIILSSWISTYRTNVNEGRIKALEQHIIKLEAQIEANTTRRRNDIGCSV